MIVWQGKGFIVPLLIVAGILLSAFLADMGVYTIDSPVNELLEGLSSQERQMFGTLEPPSSISLGDAMMFGVGFIFAGILLIPGNMIVLRRSNGYDSFTRIPLAYWPAISLLIGTILTIISLVDNWAYL